MNTIQPKLCISKTLSGTDFSGFRKILDCCGELTPSGVKNMPEELKQNLRELTPIRMRELGELNCFASSKIKEFLDTKFGQNNYTIIAIGRSVSSIAELMKYMGVDAKIIPISGLRKADTQNISANDINTYRAYLKSIGLTKEELSNNKSRKYVIMDFSYYGRTLDKMEKFLKRDDVLGDAENLIKMPVEIPLESEYIKKHFKTLFSYNRFKDYSYVGKLPVENLGDVVRQSSPKTAPEFQGNITQCMRKLFWFNVFDSYVNKNYKNCNPVTEFKALYNHYLSPRAIRLYLAREINKINNSVSKETIV